MVALLTGACASRDLKQTTLKVTPPPSFTEDSASSAKETDQISAEGESETSLNSDDYELECRTIKVTGSRFKRKIFAPIAEWAAYDKRNKRDSDRFVCDVDQASGVNTGRGTDGMGGMSTGIAP